MDRDVPRSPSIALDRPRLPLMPGSPGLQAAYNALKPGGWLVFADRVFDARWDAFRAGAAPFWDVGHPCAVKETLLDHFLSVFEEVQRRRWAKEPRAGDGRHPALQDEQIYFIGRKSAAEPVSLSFGG